MSIKPLAFEQTSSLNITSTGDKLRISTIDGLRGLLALSVFFHHAAIYQNYLRDGSWSAGSRFFSLLGPLGVALFFMITAYLFYGRLLREDGRPDWTRLYIGRFFRIGPVYVLAIAAMFLTIATASHFTIKVPLGQLTGEVLCWLALGAGPGVDVNGFSDTRHLLAGVTWTLQSEWIFYVSLPLLAFTARHIRSGSLVYLAMPVIGLALTLICLTVFNPESFPACVGPFFAGMSCAALRHGKKQPALPDWLGSLLILAALAAVFSFCDSSRTAAATMLLAVAFYLVVSGSTLFGLLTSRPALGLGAVSYGVYMFHGLVLSRLNTIDAVRDLALSSPVGFLVMVLIATALVIALAALAHIFVEAPGIRCGRLLAGLQRRTVAFEQKEARS